MLSDKVGVIGNPVLGPVLQGFTGSEGGGAFFTNLLPRLVIVAFIIGLLFFLMNFLMGAIQWINSRGDKQALETARERITNALIGVVLMFVAYAIIRFIGQFLGIDILILDINQLKIQ